MEENVRGDSSDFKAVADSVFETLLTVTTILSGAYTAIAFDWFGQAIGQRMTPEIVFQARIGIILGLIFILPLVLILMAWAFSRFRDSIVWRNVAWSGLVYCLAQDFTGLIAMLAFTQFMTGPVPDVLRITAIPLIVLIPPILGTLLGYRASIGYTRCSSTIETGKTRYALTALITTVCILSIQVLLGLEYIKLLL